MGEGIRFESCQSTFHARTAFLIPHIAAHTIWIRRMVRANVCIEAIPNERKNRKQDWFMNRCRFFLFKNWWVNGKRAKHGHLFKWSMHLTQIGALEAGTIPGQFVWFAAASCMINISRWDFSHASKWLLTVNSNLCASLYANSSFFLYMKYAYSNLNRNFFQFSATFIVTHITE